MPLLFSRPLPMPLRSLGRCFLCRFRIFLGGELLLDFGRDCGHIHLVRLGGIAQNLRGIAARGGEQDDGLDNDTAQGAFVGAAKKGCEQLSDGVVILGLFDAVLFGKDRGAVLVEQVDHMLGHKQEVAFHQPHKLGRQCRVAGGWLVPSAKIAVF